MAVTCPANVKPGDQLTVNCNGRKFSLTVPPGVRPGQTFRIQLASAPARPQQQQQQQQQPPPPRPQSQHQQMQQQHLQMQQQQMQQQQMQQMQMQQMQPGMPYAPRPMGVNGAAPPPQVMAALNAASAAAAAAANGMPYPAAGFAGLPKAPKQPKPPKEPKPPKPPKPEPPPKPPKPVVSMLPAETLSLEMVAPHALRDEARQLVLDKRSFSLKVTARDAAGEPTHAPLSLQAELVYEDRSPIMPPEARAQALAGNTALACKRGIAFFKLRQTMVTAKHQGRRFRVRISPQDVTLANERAGLRVETEPFSVCLLYTSPSPRDS